jgi:formate-dependent nitrite reductase membrane component NrfD
MATEYQRRWESRRGDRRSTADETRDSYYNVPPIHAPHWKWLIVIYFFLGGIASASYVIASIAELFGGRDARPITRAGRYISLAALLPCPPLLILDLGRPERFHHMLRVLKLRSPMSVGTWGLTIFGGFCGLSALIQAAQDGLLRRIALVQRLLLALPCRLINASGAVFGFFVGGYTGVLLAITAVPLWAKNYLLLGPLFLSSAMSNGAAAIMLALALTRGVSERTLRRLERLELFALLAELTLILSARANAGPVIARPIKQGRLGRIFRWGVLGAGITAPLLLQTRSLLARGRTSRILTVVSSLLTLSGGLMLRYVMVMAGHASADDPQATFAFTRDRRRSASPAAAPAHATAAPASPAPATGFESR